MMPEWPSTRLSASVLCGLVLWGCVAETKQATAEPVDVRAPQIEPVVISGQLRAHDGSVLDAAEVIISRTGFREAQLSPTLDAEGSFRVEVPPGVYRVVLDAPDHRAVQRTTVVSRDVRVEGRLRASARVEAEGAARTAPLKWTGESSTTIALREFHARWYAALDELRGRIPGDGNPFTMPEELRVEARELAAKARAEIDEHADPTHGLLRAAQLALFYMYCLAPSEGFDLQADIVWVVDHTSPLDLHWALPNAFLNFENAFMFAGVGRDEAFTAKVSPWFEQRAREHTVPSVAAAALGLLMYDAKQRGQTDRLAELEARTRDERFAPFFARRRAVSREQAHGSLTQAQKIPAFDFPALGQPDRRITSEALLGRIYLLEMWSTTCGPCVAELPKLHAAYAAINGASPGLRGDEAELRALDGVDSPRIEFVSISIRDSVRDVEVFRAESWSMPWTHAWLGDYGMDQLWTSFGVRSIPASVLVDEFGIVLATGDALRGDALLPTLERVLAERSVDRRP